MFFTIVDLDGCCVFLNELVIVSGGVVVYTSQLPHSFSLLYRLGGGVVCVNRWDLPVAVVGRFLCV